MAIHLTDNFQLRYPDGNEQFDPPPHIENLAKDTDEALQLLKGPLIDGAKRGRYAGASGVYGEVVITHGLGVAPTYVGATAIHPVGSPMQTVKASVAVEEVTATNFTVIVHRHDEQPPSPFAGNPVLFYWEARV